MNKHYDYLIVGAGLFGSVFSYEMRQKGKTCLVIDKRDHLAGNIYTREVRGIQVHEYGAHIFHTSNRKVWSYVQQFAEFNHFVNSPMAIYKNEIYNLPFNMNTFSRLWNLRTPKEVQAKIQEQIADLHITEPQNLEEQALSLVGTDVYEKLIKGYTEKQWGRDCSELPSFIIKRLPVRFTYDNNYFNDLYQGIPIGGYNVLTERLFEKALSAHSPKLYPVSKCDDGDNVFHSVLLSKTLTPLTPFVTPSARFLSKVKPFFRRVCGCSDNGYRNHETACLR